jgi:hypothetical protein
MEHIMNLEQQRMDILSQGAEHRRREVMHYQINIDNYRLALTEIEKNHKDDPDMAEFASNLRELLSSSLREQRKEQILLTVIEKQLEVKDVG